MYIDILVYIEQNYKAYCSEAYFCDIYIIKDT